MSNKPQGTPTTARPRLNLKSFYSTAIAAPIRMMQRLCARVHVLSGRTKELAISEARYRDLFETTPIPLWEEDFSEILRHTDKLRASGITDIRAHLIDHPEAIDEAVELMRVVDVNRAALHLDNALTKQDLLTAPSKMIRPENRGGFMEQIVAISERRQHFEGEAFQRTLGGEDLYLSVRWSVMPGHESDLSHVVVSIQNITDRIQAEKQHLELAIERERVAALEQFISGAHHDLMTPVTGLKTGLYLLDRTTTDPLQHERVKRLNEQVLHLEKIIGDFLALSRLDAMLESDLQLHPDDLNALVRQVVQEYQPFARIKQQHLHAQETKLPAVEMDTEQLRRALGSLVDNALRYTGAGSTIVVHTCQEETGVYAEVRDNGPGITPEDMPHIFDQFYRGATHRPSDGGIGVGLAIARKIAEAHGGTLTVASEQGHGAIFRLWLPTVS